MKTQTETYNKLKDLYFNNNNNNNLLNLSDIAKHI